MKILAITLTVIAILVIAGAAYVILVAKNEERVTAKHNEWIDKENHHEQSI